MGGGGYLFLGTAIGISVGAQIAGKMCKKEIDLGLSCFSLMVLAVFMCVLPMMRHTVVGTAICLVTLGVFGGLFIVPLEAYIQSFSPAEMRGQVVAAENFLGFMGVLLAPLCLFLFGKVMQVSSAAGFTLVGVMILCMCALMVQLLGGQFVQFLAKRFVHPFYKLHFIGYPFGPNFQEDRIAFYYKGRSLRNLAILLGESSKLHLFIVKKDKEWWDGIINLFSNMKVIYEPPETVSARLPVYVFTSEEMFECFEKHLGLLQSTHQLKRFAIRHTSHFKPSLRHPLKRTQATLHFDPVKVKKEERVPALVS